MRHAIACTWHKGMGCNCGAGKDDLKGKSLFQWMADGGDKPEDLQPRPHTIEEKIATFLANTRLPANHLGAVLLREAEREIRQLKDDCKRMAIRLLDR